MTTRVLIEAPIDVTAFAALAEAITAARPEWADARVFGDGVRFVIELPDIQFTDTEDH